jgi:hypothetical protein
MGCEGCNTSIMKDQGCCTSVTKEEAVPIDKKTGYCKYLMIDEKGNVKGCEIYNDPKRPEVCKIFKCDLINLTPDQKNKYTEILRERNIQEIELENESKEEIDKWDKILKDLGEGLIEDEKELAEKYDIEIVPLD